MTKRALCIGINDYPGTDQDLSGCVNDMHDWTDELDRRGFHVRTLKDAQASNRLVLEEIDYLVSQTKRSDVAVITWSCHGTWLVDTNGDEDDGRDEALCVHDFQTAGPLSDDEIAEAIAPCEGRLTIIGDSCHSGTASRAARPLLADAARAQVRFIHPSVHVLDSGELSTYRNRAHRPVRRKPSSAIMLSGCRDFEYSYDAEFNGRPNGAFTRVMIDALKRYDAAGQQPTNRQLYQAVREFLPSPHYPQTPQITATRSQLNWLALT